MPPDRRRAERLAPYRARRSADRTPEPFGGADPRPGLFVVQQHAARRLHYDFRLEIDGVLRSWAVPKGPSLDPSVKRLAVATEDHPVEYADFEGVIPEGNYGAGAVIVWDRGLAVHHEDPSRADETGKLLFELKGYKLRGLWTLVRTSRDEREWLLIKKPDAAARGAGEEGPGEASVLSGLTVEELRDGEGRSAELLGRLERSAARRRRLRLTDVKPMLATLRREPFSGAEWLFELKYDGYRVLAETSRDDPSGARGEVRLAFRSGRDATSLFPEVVRALASLPYAALLVDGEVVVLDDEARPRFSLLQQRAQLSRPAELEAAAVRLPATLYAFDLLGFAGLDLRPLPLEERKQALARVLPAAGPVRLADHVEARGEALYEEVRRRGLEGVIGKRRDAPYRGGRSAAWVKVRADKTGDFAVVGYTRPRGGRTGFGALHLAALAGGRLTWVGRVGSGFDEATLAGLRDRLDRAPAAEPPAAGDPPSGREHVWVEPELVVEVRYTERTPAGQLRHPVFTRVRDDKAVADCLLDDAPPPPGAPPAGARPAPPREVEIARPDKLFWPDDGITKGDLAHYYREVSPWLLPYLRDRPLVIERFPDGIGGKSFFQKNAPDFCPDWLRTEILWSPHGGKETRTFVCDDERALAWVINSGAVPLHVWASRVGRIDRPDWCVLDLDAKDAPFESVVEVAREMRRLTREIGLPTFPKTSGGTGLHVLIPLAGALGFAGARQLGELVARVVAGRLPEIASVARLPEARPGKVYVDFLQNGFGKLLVAPFSVRPRPGAPVSMPLRWREVRPGLDPAAHTLRTAPRRLRRMRGEPLAPVLTTAPDLGAALERLGDLV